MISYRARQRCNPLMGHDSHPEERGAGSRLRLTSTPHGSKPYTGSSNIAR